MTIQPLWTADDIARATGARIAGDILAGGVSIDSRTIEPGDIFIALNGPGIVRDGHEFVAQAFARGASAAIVSRQVDDFSDDSRLLRVADTQKALEDMGKARRADSAAPIIGITGSVGKTGTKEALRHVLSFQGRTHASAASYNNLWGVPLSLARMPKDAEFGIFEIGMNHAGEIAPLSRQVRPHAAIITTVEPVHLEFFDSVENIADAKAEIFEGMDRGTAILNRDNPHYDRLAATVRRNPNLSIRSFGSHAQADVRLLEFSGDDQGSDIRVTMNGRVLSGHIGQAGRHIANNALAILAGVDAIGADIDTALNALGSIGAIEGRGLRHQIAWGNGEMTIIDESYNASPPSIRAALTVLASMKTTGRRIAVLGDMRELGPQSDALHAGLADAVADHVDLLFTCGTHMRALFDATPASKRAAHASNSAELAPTIRRALRANDIVMIKGSLGSAMGVVVKDLLKKAEG